MTKFIRILIIINGLLIPSIAVVVIYKLLAEAFTDYDYQPDIIVGENLSDAKKDSVAIQGISYETPLEIPNSTNLYLPISVVNYEEARSLKTEQFLASSSPRFKASGGYYGNYLNILFLNKDYGIIRRLLNKKGIISEIRINHGDVDYPQSKIDTTVKHIAYRIGFQDSNQDGKLNSEDDHDLYISTLDGDNLTQITNAKDVVEFKFLDSNKKILIQYKERSKQREEYKRVKFATYTIATKTFSELTDVEKNLNEIESQLIR